MAIMGGGAVFRGVPHLQLTFSAGSTLVANEVTKGKKGKGQTFV